MNSLRPRLKWPLSGGDHGPFDALMIPAAALATVTAIAMLHPHPLVLPTLSIILKIAGLGLAGVVMLRDRQMQRGLAPERFLLPALVFFFGCAAGMIGDPDPAVQSLTVPR